MLFEGQLRIKITPVRRPESKLLDMLLVKLDIQNLVE